MTVKALALELPKLRLAEAVSQYKVTWHHHLRAEGMSSEC